MVINHNPGLSFDDVLLVPKLGQLDSRRDANLHSTLFNAELSLPLPILSAPMSSVTESEMAIAMYSAGGLGVLHRFMDVDEQIKQHKIVQSAGASCMVAVGIAEQDRVKKLIQAGCHYLCLDVAHAHHERVGQFLDSIAEDLRVAYNHTWITVGNVATAEGARYLVDHGADAIKVGIGPGAACTTRAVTGFGVPQLSAIMEVAQEVGDEVRIIADGGIRNSGDIVKALAAGADTVMLGRLLAGADESPFPGLYFGMASKRVNNHHAPEGAEGSVLSEGPVEGILKQLAYGIKSGVSYAGATNLLSLRENAEFRIVTAQSLSESGTRI